IRVIDAATYIAAPGAATALADFGAEVIKIERPPHGDPYRYLVENSGMPASEHNYCWILDGRSKKSLALNLGEEAGRDILIQLVRTADVFLTNFLPAQLNRFRLQYEDLRAANERLIYASVTGYGETGPDAGLPGFDMTAYWARSGLMDFIHNPDAEPTTTPSGFGDHPTAMALFGAVMLALYQRERTGRGMKVSTTLMACGAWSHGCFIQAALCGAQFIPRRTRREPHNPLVNHYLSSDGRRFLFCLIEPRRDWPRLCRAMGREEWIDDERFCTPALRRENARALVALLDEEFGQRPMEKWARRFAAAEVAWSPVPSAAELVMDPQMAAQGAFPEIEGAGMRTLDTPIRVEGVQKTPPRRAPAIGEHTHEILASLGYSAGEIEKLAGDGVVQA
ncbi:MAG: CaiB/BaiF CoA transferase family protein, partial [Bryobacteraceae bacterium]